MSKNVLVIGGTRLFGKLLVERLLQDGSTVTLATRGRTPDSFGKRVQRIVVDRRDAAAMTAALADKRYDLVYDQMCYSPLDAAISLRVFGGHTGRYVMASTIEVYAHLLNGANAPFIEDALELDAERIELDYPWHAPDLPDHRYGAGKRQAEALLYRGGTLPVVTVRIGHVLAGPEDFTGRLANYVNRVADMQPLRYSAGSGKSSFISAHGIADFLHWTGEQSFLGPVNAASDGPLSALDLHQHAAQVLGKTSTLEPVNQAVLPSQISPFDYPSPYVMDTARAQAHGYRFEHSDQWLDDVIRQHQPIAA